MLEYKSCGDYTISCALRFKGRTYKAIQFLREVVCGFLFSAWKFISRNKWFYSRGRIQGSKRQNAIPVDEGFRLQYKDIYCERGNSESRFDSFGNKVTRIRSIKFVGELPTWDIQVEEDESYVAGGFINHNSNPNLLNIPARKIPEYRELFIPKYDKLIVADISQQEPRILAALSGDKKLLDIFNTGQDIHLMVTRAAFNDDTIVKSDPRRDVGKIINLATSYGMTAIGLARKLGISVEEAERFLNAYFARFPQVYENKQKQQEFANRFGYVESITGRRIWINRHNYQWSNNAINAPIQSSAADFTKLWLYKLLTKCRKGAILYPVCNVVYDEIVADSPKELVDTYKTLILEAFDETAKELFPQVPFEMDMKVGKNWGCKHLEKEEE